MTCFSILVSKRKYTFTIAERAIKIEVTCIPLTADAGIGEMTIGTTFTIR